MAHGKVVFRYTQPLSYEKPYVDANGDALTSTPARQQRRDTHALSRCAQDSSLASRLSLAPHLATSLFASDKRAIVTSSTRKTVFTGRIFLDLLPLLAKGEQTGEQLVQSLASKHTDMQVRTALYHLIAKNILVSSEHSLTTTQALFWSSAGLSPCMAQQRLAALPLHVASLTDEAFERAAFLFSHRDEIYRQARFGDFKDGEAIAPNEIALFSETQYKHREAINAQRHNFYYVPQPFDLESDLLEEINYLRSSVENKGMEVLVHDMTRADVDYHVAKVIVPGLRHFWCRLAPGRLYDVPVARGQLSQAHTEEEMNPIAMFL